jgi:hypothetical protein
MMIYLRVAILYTILLILRFYFLQSGANAASLNEPQLEKQAEQADIDRQAEEWMDGWMDGWMELHRTKSH